MHISQRIFVGDPPADPKDFLNRYILAMCVSAPRMASDYRPRGGFTAAARLAIREKHGLIPHFPLEEKLKSYYGPDLEDNHRLKRHAIFNLLYKL
jgi:hypothetical protein